MKRKDIYMVNTEIEVIKTIGEIQGYLVRMGADRIATHFENGEPAAVYFSIPVNGNNRPFQLPARIEPIYKILHAGRGYRQEESDKAQAKRVAWRQIYRWIQSQLAFIDTGMASAAEVFSPYMQVAPNQTLYQAIEAGRLQNLLPESTVS